MNQNVWYNFKNDKIAAVDVTVHLIEADWLRIIKKMK